MGCFWGAERHFWELPGVYSTVVGYAGGFTPNPTYQEVCTGMTGHNDVGTQYRSGIYTFDEQQQAMAEASREHYQHVLQQVTAVPVPTEIVPTLVFYFAEAYHQQYLAKNPAGYCGLGGTGVCYPSLSFRVFCIF
jgi:peptide-methionine (S)-S-oxide reductase